VAFSPDGTRIVSAGSGDSDKPGEVFVWDARMRTHEVELVGHTGSIYHAVFSPDRTRIATAGNDKTIKVWDARTGTTLVELKGHTNEIESVAFGPDGTRIVTSSIDQTVRVWDARTGTELARIETGARSAAFNLDGTRIVTEGYDKITKVWDAQTGQELNGEAVPKIVPSGRTSPDGRLLAHLNQDRADVVPLIPDAEELAYRRVHTRPNLGRYRDGYRAALAARDPFAAQFYLNLLPPPEQARVLDDALAACRQAIQREPGNAGRHVRLGDVLTHKGQLNEAIASYRQAIELNPQDTELSLKVAALQAWFGQEKDLAATRQRILAFAKGKGEQVADDHVAERAAKACSILPSTDKAELEAAVALGRAAAKVRQDDRTTLALGMAEYRSGDFAAAEKSLLTAVMAGPNNPEVMGTASFYRAMCLFQQGKKEEARQLATGAATRMKPLPRDEKNPLAGFAGHDDLMQWLAYKEAKAMIQFDAAAVPEAKSNQK
jgi:tetratricopeptide (TPR) repeat protein